MPLVRFFDMTSLSCSQNEVTLQSNLMLPEYSYKLYLSYNWNNCIIYLVARKKNFTGKGGTCS